MGLHKFNKERELRKLKFKQNRGKYIKIGTLILSVFILVMGIIYFTYSKFTVTNKFNVVNAKVGSFTTTTKINYYADGTQVSTIPSSASYIYSTSSCDSGATYSFNEATWTGTVTKGEKKINITCNVYFIIPAPSNY